MYQVSLKLRPNNQITITQGQYKNLGKEIYRTASQSKPDSLRLRRALHNLGKRNSNALRSDMQPYDRSSLDKRKRNGGDRLFSSLDITKKSQDIRGTRSRSGFGEKPKPKNFTNASGQKLRECGAAIDHHQSDLSKIHCATLTLPCGTHESFDCISRFSGWIINRLFQPIRDKYGSECLWFFVWEYQKRGAPHLHIAVSHDRDGEAKRIGDKLICDWIKILHQLSDLSGVCLFTSHKGDRCTLPKFYQNDNQAMRKGLGRYFSKYAGKKESKQAWYCQKYPVSRFWGCCYELKRIIKSLSFELKMNFEDSRSMDELISNILDRVLSLCQISCLEQYSFQVNIGTDSHPHIIADGERTILYIFPKMLTALRDSLSDDPIYF